MSPSAVPKDAYPAEMLPNMRGIPRPDLLTTRTVRLALSPNSAGGTPEISSMDCTVFGETWVDNVQPCWSELRRPSKAMVLYAFPPLRSLAPFQPPVTAP